MKLIFINRFFYPDHSATSQMLTDVAFSMSERRRVVAVITSRKLYEDPSKGLPSEERVQGVSVYRVWTSSFGRQNLFGRMFDYVTFYVSSGWRLWRLTRSGDVVVAKTDPPLVSVIAGLVCWLRSAHLVNWLQDIFPESAEVLGIGGRAARACYPPLRWVRNFSLKAARANVVLGERMRKQVCNLSIPSNRIHNIPNWANGSTIVPVDRNMNPLTTEWNLRNEFVVCYSGNLGRAHEIDTFLEAMSLLEEASPAVAATPDGRVDRRRPVVWLFIGGGKLFDRLQSDVASRRLSRVHFKPYQPQALLAQSLSFADLHLVSLQPRLEGLIVPSKFYGICAAARPTVFVGSRDGEIAELVRHYDCGRTIEAGDGQELARTIIELAGQPALCKQLGDRARAAFEANFDRPIAMKRWEVLLLEVSGGTEISR